MNKHLLALLLLLLLILKSYSQCNTLSASITSYTNVSCYGYDDGTITVTATGGTPPYTYTSNGPTVYTNLTYGNMFDFQSGTYTITVKDSNGCLVTTSSQTLTQPTAVSASVTTKISCIDSNSITVNASGGVLPYEYEVEANGGYYKTQNSNIFDDIPGGTYFCVVKDANGCGNQVNGLTLPTALTAGAVHGNVLCYGQANGQFDIDLAGGTLPYQCSLNGGSYQSFNTTIASFYGLGPGNYYGIVKDANNCTVITDTLTITQPLPYSVTMSASATTICTGSSTTITATETGSGNYIYNWSTGVNGSNSAGYTSTISTTVSPTSTTTYSVYISDNNNTCGYSTSSIVITVLPTPKVTTSASPSTICLGSSSTITATPSGGTAPYTYNWSTGITNSSISVSPTSTTSYTATIADKNGCSSAASTSVTVKRISAPTTSAAGPTSFCRGQSVSLSAQDSSSGVTYTWYKNGTAVWTGTPYSVSTAGIYTVQASISPGCTATSAPIVATVLSTPAPVLSTPGPNPHIACPETGIKHIVSDTTSNISYQWLNYSTGAIIPGATNTSYTTYIENSDSSIGIIGFEYYSVKVTSNVSGCSVTVTKWDTSGFHPDPSKPILTASRPTISCGGADTLSVSPVSGITYQWNNGSAAIAGATNSKYITSTAGSYSVTATNTYGCIATSSETISETSSLAVNVASFSNITCSSGSNGSITVAASGGTSPYQYSINGGTTYQKSNVFTGLTATSYTIIIKDTLGCTASVSQAIGTLSTPLAVTTSVTNVSCYGNSNGSIKVAATGGAGSYTYSDGGAFSSFNIFTGLTGGNYTITVQDSIGCTGTTVVTVSQPSAINLFASAIPSSSVCAGGSTELATAGSSGGTGPYTYSWSPSTGLTSSTAANPFASPTSTTTYTVTMKDANGCSATSSPITVTVSPSLSVTATPTNISCYGLSNGSITVTATGGTSPYQYSINNGTSYQSSNEFSNLAVGTYKIVVKDAIGCISSTYSATITQPTAVLSVSTTLYNATCYGGTGTIVTTATGGTSPYTYSIDGGTIFTSDAVFSNVPVGASTILVKDANGCTTTTSATITQPAQLSVTVTASGPTSFCNGDSVILTASSPNSGLTYSWNNATPYPYVGNGATNSTYVAKFSGKFSVTIGNSSGCGVTSAPISITASPTTPLITSSSNTICIGNYIPITVYTFDTSSNLTYQWYSQGTAITGATNYSYTAYTPTTSNNFTVAVTSTVTGCSATSAQKIIPVTEPIYVSVTAGNNTICKGSSTMLNASVTFGGTAPYTYSWEPAAGLTNATIQNPSVNPTSTTSYAVRVTDANGCFSSYTPAQVIVDQGPSVSITPFDVTCNGIANGSLTIAASGGFSPYSYSDDGGTTYQTSNVFNNLIAGTYSIIVEDTNGCSTTTSQTISQPAVALNTTSTSTNTTCNSANNGTITVTTSGGTSPYSYSNNGGATYQTSNVFNNLPAGTYTITVEDTNGCTTAASQTITQQSTLIASIFRSNDTLYATTSGGANPYMYNWYFGGQTVSVDSFIVINQTGNYTDSITDANNCSALAVYTVNSDTIHGQVNGSGYQNTKVYLLKLNPDSSLQVVDSTNIINGTFTLASIYSPVYIYYVPDSSVQSSHVPSYYNSIGDTTAFFNGASPITLPLTVNNIVITTIAGADSGGTGIISGVITLPDSNFRTTSASATIASGIKIILMDSLNRPVQISITDSLGNFYFSGLQPGSYHLMADKPFFPNINPPVISISVLNNNQSNQAFILTKTSLERASSVTSIIKPTTFSDNINLYPNPTKDIVYVSIDNSKINSFYYSFSDMAGKMVKSGMASTSINISALESGIYIVCIQTNNAVTYKKLIVE